MHMKDCIFCKIVKGELPSSVVAESEHALAFLDIAPVNQGHTLVIPRGHYESYMELPDHILSDMALLVKKISPAIKDAVDADGISISMNNGKAAGQEIFHAHFHIMPRYESDGFRLWPQKKYVEGEMQEIQKKILSSL